MDCIVHGVAKSRTRLSDFTFTFHFHALENGVEDAFDLRVCLLSHSVMSDSL